MIPASTIFPAVFYFCGLGGGTRGFRNAGFHCILAVDNEPDALAAHQQFVPGVPVDPADLRFTHPADVLRRNGIDPATFAGVLVCSPPCPGFANCGKRDPDAATNDLLRVPGLLAAACPRAWIVVENVRGLLAFRNRPRLLELLDAFRASGRDAPSVRELREKFVLDAKIFGVPQHRERVIIIISPRGEKRIGPPARTTPIPITLGAVIGPGSGFCDPDPRAISLSATEAVCYFRQDNAWTRTYMGRLGNSSRLLHPQRWDRPCDAVISYVGNGGTGRVALIHPNEPRLLSLGERMGTQRLPLDRGPIPADVIAAHRLIGDAIPVSLAERVGLHVLAAMRAALQPPVIAAPYSNNAKLGGCAATYASQATCPTDCPFLGHGCYGEHGNCGRIAERLNSSAVCDPIAIACLEAHLIGGLDGSLDLRVHSLGDCPSLESARIVSWAMSQFELRSKKSAWTYTHAWRVIPVEDWNGVNVLASCETIEQVRDARARGYATSIVVPEHHGKNAYIRDGIKFIPCPEQTVGRTCTDCRLCMRTEKLIAAGVTIAFETHGSGANLVRDVLCALQPRDLALAARNATTPEDLGSSEARFEPAPVTATQNACSASQSVALGNAAAAPDRGSHVDNLPSAGTADSKPRGAAPEAGAAAVGGPSASAPQAALALRNAEPALLTSESSRQVGSGVNCGAGFFSHIYERDSQIAIIRSAVDAAVSSGFRQRFHSLLYGPPACGKSEILAAFRRLLGADRVLMFDATATTSAGAEEFILNAPRVPPFIFIEEIEKVGESTLRWLLAVLDHRAEIVKTTASSGHRRRVVRALCIATANDIRRFESVLSGALASRFAHKVYCPPPSCAVLQRILLREIERVGGNPLWIQPALDFCETVERTRDPRRIIAVCLSGRDRLLTGEFQNHLRMTRSA